MDIYIYTYMHTYIYHLSIHTREAAQRELPLPAAVSRGGAIQISAATAFSRA